MKTNEIIQKSTLIRDYLKYFYDAKENPIDMRFLPIPPYKVSQEIKLIIIGQDPTIRNVTSRGKIDSTLNLDKPGALKKYISNICRILCIDFQKVYATNIFKYFYTKPPADTFQVLMEHIVPNIKLLKAEISQYPNIPIITLGEPVLRLLVLDGFKDKMTHYWAYDKKTKNSHGNFKYCKK